jgi:hypothetical protein
MEASSAYRDGGDCVFLCGGFRPNTSAARGAVILKATPQRAAVPAVFQLALIVQASSQCISYNRGAYAILGESDNLSSASQS